MYAIMLLSCVISGSNINFNYLFVFRLIFMNFIDFNKIAKKDALMGSFQHQIIFQAWLFVYRWFPISY